MSWQPKYRITDSLLLTMRRIGEVLGEVRGFRLTPGSLTRLESEARACSAHASTSIEGNPLALADVKKLLQRGKGRIRDTEREVLNYNRALQSLYRSVREGSFELSLKTLETVQGQVTAGLMEHEADCGRIRQVPVLIRNPRRADEVIFIPPDAKDVKHLTQDLLDFVNGNLGGIDPIILAGIFHRQCVVIHPFMDGNGRTTRLLTTAILGQAGFDLFEIFSFENYYNRNISRYFRAVGLEGDYYELQGGIDFTEWLEYFADGILDELTRVRRTLSDEAAPPPRLEAHHRQILNYIDRHGSITQREYGTLSPRSLAARKQDFEKLLNLGLIKAQGKSRGTYYIRKAAAE